MRDAHAIPTGLFAVDEVPKLEELPHVAVGIRTPLGGLAGAVHDEMQDAFPLGSSVVIKEGEVNAVFGRGERWDTEGLVFTATSEGGSEGICEVSG